MVQRVVAVGEIAGTIRLVVQAVVGLRAVRDVRRVPRADGPIHAAVIAGFIERTRDDSRGLNIRKSGGSLGQFRERGGIFRKALALAFTLDGEEPEEFIFHERSADGTTKLLTAVIGMVGDEAGAIADRIFLGGVEGG